MSHTAFADSLIIVGVVVAIVTAFASLPHPAVGRPLRIIGTIILFGAAAWVIVAVVASHEDKPPVTETSASSTAPDPKPAPPTITYPPAPEPTEPVSTTHDVPATETERVSQQPVSKPEPEVRPQPSEIVPKQEIEPHHEPAKPPQDKWALKREALSFMERADYPDAINAWTTWIRTYSGPDERADHTAYFELGLAYEMQQDWSGAIHALERANIITSGNDAETLVHLGRCYERRQRWSDALKAYEEVLRIEPQNALASHGRSVARRNLSR